MRSTLTGSPPLPVDEDATPDDRPGPLINPDWRACELFAANRMLAKDYAWRHLRRDRDLMRNKEDYLQEMDILLYRACRTFDPKKGALSTHFYARALWVTLRLINKYKFDAGFCGGILSFPGHIFRDVTSKMASGRPMTPIEEEAAAAISARRGLLGTESLITAREPDDDEDTEEERAAKFARLLEALDKIPDDERAAILYRYGIDREFPIERTVEEVSDKMDRPLDETHRLINTGIAALARLLTAGEDGCNE